MLVAGVVVFICHDCGMVSMDVVEYRPGFGRALAVAALVLGAIVLVASLVADPWAGLRMLPGVALVVYCIWAAYWWPAVVVSPAGVELRNITRTIELPWPAIQRVDTKWALTLFTAYGSYSAWAAPAPGRSFIGRQGTMDRQGGDVLFRDDAARIPESARHGGTIRAGDLPGSSSGQAALIVRRRWEELRDAGLLDNARLERAQPVVRWHWQSALTILILALATLLTIAL